MHPIALARRLDTNRIYSAGVRGQFLFGWTPNPGTSLYVGYNDDLFRNGYSPFTGQLEPGFRRKAAPSSSKCLTCSGGVSTKGASGSDSFPRNGFGILGVSTDNS